MHPCARGLATTFSIAGTLLANNPAVMAFAWLAVLLPLILGCRVARPYSRFLLVILLPVAIALVVVWGYFVAAPPGTAVGSDPAGGLRFAATVVIRLALLGGILQLAIVTIPSTDLPHVLYRWGIKGDALVMVLGAWVLMPELQLRSTQVLTARLARGIAPNRSVMSRMRQFPHMLRPLLAWALRSAIQRSETWHQKRLLSQLHSSVASHVATSRRGDLVYVVLGGSWMALNLLTRFLV